jgi:hypothetical protein
VEENIKDQVIASSEGPGIAILDRPIESEMLWLQELRGKNQSDVM